MPITFMHTGDEHIDSDSHGVLNPKTGVNTAWESNYATIRHLAEQAVERGADAFLSTGDAFKTGRPSQEALLMMVDAYSPLAEAGIPTLFLDGNHNRQGVPAGHRSVIYALAEMLRARGGTAVASAAPELVELGGLQIATLPWLSKNTVLNLLDLHDLSPNEGDVAVSEYAMRELERLAGLAAGRGELIMASHVTVDDFRIAGVADAVGRERGSELELAHLFSEPVLPRKKLELLPFRYGALSHIHTPQAPGKVLHYSGSPNRLTFTDEKDVKGGNFVTLADDGSLAVERVVTPARLMATIDLDDETFEQRIESLEAHTLVRVLLPVGEPELNKEIRSSVVARGAVIVETKGRPAPREVIERITLPEKTDPVSALREWAALNTKLDADLLVSAAANLEN